MFSKYMLKNVHRYLKDFKHGKMLKYSPKTENTGNFLLPDMLYNIGRSNVNVT